MFLFVLEFLVSGGVVVGCLTGVKWYAEAGADLGSGQDAWDNGSGSR